jgi:phosphonate transport system substrate-binding protein
VTLRFTSLQADNAASFYRQVVHYLGRAANLDVEFAGDPPWTERERKLDRGDIHGGFICSWPYTRKFDSGVAIELAAAPVFRSPRYQSKPVYFSDVVVRRDSAIESFANLRGKSWAYNESKSHSGYNLTLFHLAELGETEGYFAEVVESGAHQASLDHVLEGRVAGSSIDSYVLEVEMKSRPELSSELRVIDNLGPSPSPPFVIASSLEPDVKQRIRTALTEMHESPEGEAILRQGLASRFDVVTNRDYDSVRRMSRLATAARMSTRAVA